MCPSGPQPIGGVVALYEFANGLSRRGHHVQLIHLDVWGRRIESLDDLSRFRFEPEVVHFLPGDDPDSVADTDVVFATNAPRRLGLPVLLVQGFEMLYDHLERQAFRTPCLKVCIASWLIDVGAVFGAPREQFRVAPMGIDHIFRTTVPPEQRSPQVAMLYSNHPAKGWGVGLQVLHAARQQVPNLRATVFGTRLPPEPLPEWVTFHLDPDPAVLVSAIYNESQVFLQPSWYEGFGFTAVEAMASGCAVVSTDNGGSRDYAFHGETALVSRPGDVAGLTSQVVRLLHDAELRLRLVEAAQSHIAAFDWDRGAQALEAHLQDYLDDPLAFQQPPGTDQTVALGLAQGDLADRILRESRSAHHTAGTRGRRRLGCTTHDGGDGAQVPT